MSGWLLILGLFVGLSTPSIVIALQQRRYHDSWRQWLHGSAIHEQTERKP